MQWGDGRELDFMKISQDAFVPRQGSCFTAGFDLFSPRIVDIPPCDRALVLLDIAIKLPIGTYGRIAPRSGLALTHFVSVGGGVIDCDFVGNLGVILFNHSGEAKVIHRGDRIAQLIVEKICYPTLVEVGFLDKTERGENGFGSTGM